MTEEDERKRVRGSNLTQFERNRYFYGKLMSARDMQAEQDYHVGRLNTLNRLVVGRGIVRGLDVQEVTEDDGLEVTVEPGIALDGHGRVIVVDSTETERLPAPAAEQINLYLTHEEASKDQVPVPTADRTVDEACEFNRVLETYSIEYSSGDPSGAGSGDDGAPTGGKQPVTDIEFPTRGEVQASDTPLSDLARDYKRDHLATAGDGGDTDVYLGSFERGSDGWESIPELDAWRPHVYTNDMLYDILVNHITDQENPHDLEGFVDAQLEDLVGERLTELVEAKLDDIVEDRLANLEGRLDSLEAQNTALERYVITDTLESKISAFSHVADEFDSGTADVIAEQSKEHLREMARREPDPDAFLEFVETVLERETALVHEQGDDATGDTMERYEQAVNELERAIEEASTAEGVIEVAAAQKKVSRAASSLRRG